MEEESAPTRARWKCEVQLVYFVDLFADSMAHRKSARPPPPFGNMIKANTCRRWSHISVEQIYVTFTVRNNTWRM